MDDFPLQSANADSPLAEDVVVFYDEFVEFQAYCAFLCDALSSMAIAHMELDDVTRHGITVFSGQLKLRVEVLKMKLKQIHEKSSASE